MKKFKRLDRYVVYQPKVNLNTLEIVGVEALIRFIEPRTNKILDTEKVIDSIECIDDMMKLTIDVFDIVVSDIKTLKDLNCNMSISINISSEELCNKYLFSWIDERFRNKKNYANKIEIEITEKQEIKDILVMRESISLLKNLGFSISIDDLGSGFNQIDMIENYNVDLVKVDKGMARNFNNKKKELRSIADISKKKNIRLLAEGIESEEDLNNFLNIGFELGQGYYFYKPMKLEELIETTDLLKVKIL